MGTFTDIAARIEKSTQLIKDATRTLEPPTIDTKQALRDQFGGLDRDQLNDDQKHIWDRTEEQWIREEQRLQKLMSPPGALGLPPLLEQRRLEWRIPDGAFRLRAAFDRVLIYQIETNPSGKLGRFFMTELGKDADKRSAPRGVLVDAGLAALDSLRSHGIDLGHIVNYVHVNPLRIQVDFVDGKRPQVLVMIDRDIVASEDLADIIKSGAARVDFIADRGKHQLVDQEGNAWDPVMPWLPTKNEE